MKKTARCIVIVIKFQLSNSDLVIVLCFSIKFTFHVCLCSTVVKASLWKICTCSEEIGFLGDVTGKCYFLLLGLFRILYV